MRAVDSTVRRALLTVDADILKTEDALASAKERLERAEGAQPFDLQAVINAEVEVENFTAVLERANDIRTRLFVAN